MNYEEQCLKDKPFEGLSPEEAKYLFVYMCYVAHPNLTQEDIEKRWGKVLPPEGIPTVFEAMEMAERIKDGMQVRSPTIQSKDISHKDDTKNSPRFFLFSLLLALCVGIVIIGGLYLGYQMPQRKQDEILREQEEEQRRNEEQIRNEVAELLEEASVLLADHDASSTQLVECALGLQRLREKMCFWPKPWDAEERLITEEMILKCYKSAVEKVPPVAGNKKYAASIEAAYRISLLYLPSSYRDAVEKKDHVAPLGQNKELALKYLDEAVSYNHYKAISLRTSITMKDYSSLKFRADNPSKFAISFTPSDKQELIALEAKVRVLQRWLAQHPEAKGHDVYLYAKTISKLSPEESLRYLKKAAAMGDNDAISEIRKLRQKALERGNLFDEKDGEL